MEQPINTNEVHDYERCDRWAWKTRCPARATIFYKTGAQWCPNHAPPHDQETIHAIRTLERAGLIQKQVTP